jgi:HAE1 family hydrophobic/amphiphilic exporter-1
MATSIVGGMLTSMILTLVVVPVVYSVLDDFGIGLQRLLCRDTTVAEATERQGEARKARGIKFPTPSPVAVGVSSD